MLLEILFETVLALFAWVACLKYLRDHETTILHILGTEILGLFQVDLLSNFRLEMTTEHIPALSGSLYCCFLAIRMCLILKYRIFFEKEKINFVNVIIG